MSTSSVKNLPTLEDLGILVCTYENYLTLAKTQFCTFTDRPLLSFNSGVKPFVSSQITTFIIKPDTNLSNKIGVSLNVTSSTLSYYVVAEKYETILYKNYYATTLLYENEYQYDNAPIIGLAISAGTACVASAKIVMYNNSLAKYYVYECLWIVTLQISNSVPQSMTLTKYDNNIIA